jgi:hypothetical protein
MRRIDLGRTCPQVPEQFHEMIVRTLSQVKRMDALKSEREDLHG